MMDYHEVISFVLDYVESNQYLLTNAYNAVGQAGLRRLLYLDFISCVGSLIEQGANRQGVSLDEASARAKATCGRFGLPLDEAPFSLSRGQRQMVALASVVVGEPQVIVLDEPTSGLDYRECMTVMETVRDMASRGSAVVMVCHDMEVVSDFADRLVVMANGEILGSGTCAQVFAKAGLMQRACVEPPQAIALAEKLAAEVSPAFSGLSEVADIVAVAKELANRA